jgi:glycosyltransferase involved in cell wall biosynthesis
MLIGIDASRANRENRTGTEWYAFHLIKALLQKIQTTDKVRLYVKEPLRQDWGDLSNQVTVKVLKWPPKFLWTHFRLAWEIFWHRVDLLFVPAHTIPIISFTPIITTLHDIGFEHAAELYNHKIQGTKKSILRICNAIIRLFTLSKYGASEVDYHKFSARLALKHCIALTTVSEYSRKDIAKQYNYPLEKIYLVPNGIANNIYNSEIRNHHEKIISACNKVGITDPYFVNLGRIEKKKNTLFLVQAFHNFLLTTSNNEFRLLLLGTNGYGSQQVMEYIKQNNLQKNILTPGWISQDAIPYLLAGAQLFIFPSLFEGFGVPVLEAMAVGTPVICSNTTSLPEVAGEAAYFIDPENLSSLVEAINKVINNRTLQQDLREKGYKQIQQFSWSLSAEKLLALFHSVLKT